MIGPNCPGVLSPGKANVGIIPAEVFAAGLDRPRLALGHADLPDRLRAGPARARQLDASSGSAATRSSARRSSTCSSASRPTPRPSWSCSSARSAATRRRRRRASRRRADVEAGVRLHRRLLGAAREDDGPRGRDHLRLAPGTAQAKKEALEAVGIAVGTTPTEVAELVAERWPAVAGERGRAATRLERMDTISFARGVPAPECLPRRSSPTARAPSLERDGKTILSYGSGAGYAPLREHDRRVVRRRPPRRVLLTNGALQGFVLLAQHFGARADGARRAADLRPRR